MSNAMGLTTVAWNLPTTRAPRARALFSAIGPLSKTECDFGNYNQTSLLDLCGFGFTVLRWFKRAGYFFSAEPN